MIPVFFMNIPVILRRIAIIFCTLAVLLPSLSGAVETISIPTYKESGISIQMTPAFQEWNNNGFMPVRIEISNPTPYPGHWELTLHKIFGAEKVRFNYEFDVPPGKTFQEIIYPSLNGDNSIVSFSWSGPGVDASTGKSSILTNSTNWRSRSECALIGEKSIPEKLEADFKERFDNDGNWNPQFSVMDWPADPRVYSSKDAMVMPEETFKNRLDEAHRQAILEWVATGKALWLISEDKNRGILETPHLFGKISILPDISQMPLKEKKGQLDKLVENVKKFTSNKSSMPNISFEESMEYKLGEPSLFLGITLFVFAILAGPVCLKYWAPVGKRQRLFILLPSLALVFSLILGMAIMLSEGIGGEGVRKTNIVLFPDSHSASISQKQICRTGVVIGNSFPLNENVSIKSQYITHISEDSASYENRGSFIRNQTTASGSWFPDRTMLSQELSTNIPTRARVTLLSEGEKAVPVFQSTFPSTLNDMVYRDSQGKFWSISTLPPGEKVKASSLVKPKKEYEQMSNMTFTAQAEPGEIGPISTHPAIRWNQDLITVSGVVSHQSSSNR